MGSQYLKHLGCVHVRATLKSSMLTCKKGAIITLRHNQLRNITPSLLTEVCHGVRIEPLSTWKVFKYRVFYGPYFPVFGLNMEIYFSVLSLNTGKYAPEKAPYLDTFHAVTITKADRRTI